MTLEQQVPQTEAGRQYINLAIYANACVDNVAQRYLISIKLREPGVPTDITSWVIGEVIADANEMTEILDRAEGNIPIALIAFARAFRQRGFDMTRMRVGVGLDDHLGLILMVAPLKES